MAFDLSEVLKDVSSPDTDRQQIQYIPLDQIDPDQSNFYSLEGLDELAGSIPKEELKALKAILREDPRPAYQEDPDRVYGLPFGGRDVHFRVDGNILTVIDYA